MRPALNLELDLGLDSMTRVELLSRLEEELGGNVEESQLMGNLQRPGPARRRASERGQRWPGGPGTRPTFAGWHAILSEDLTTLMSSL